MDRQQKNKKRAVQVGATSEAEVLEGKLELLQEVVDSLYNTIFLQRYRDSVDDIRICCLSAISRCIVGNQETFLHDTYLKYVGWMLHDRRSATVRLMAVQQLHAVYKVCLSDLDPLRNFTERFETRIVEMCHDVDTKVTAEALRLVN